MAYRRNLAVRAQCYCKQGFSSSFAYLHLENDDRSKLEAPKVHKISRRGFIGSRSNSLLGFGEISQNRRCSKTIFPSLRYMSTSTGENAGDMLNEMKDALELQAIETMESSIASQAPALSEVAVAAADSYFPSASFQYLIDGVHSFSGINWWASIAVATILVRVIETPLLINYNKIMKKWDDVKFTSPSSSEVFKDYNHVEFDKLLTRTSTEMKSRGEKFKRVCKASGLIHSSIYCVPAISVFVFLSTFFAIRNMVENVPSLKSGGIYWFTDLTTPDSSYMLPVLTAVTYWMSVEGYKQTTSNLGIMTSEEFSRITDKGYDKMSSDEAMKLDDAGMKVIHLIVMALIPVFIGELPKAYFCCWITSNMYTFIFRLAMESALAKQLFGLQTKVKLK